MSILALSLLAAVPLLAIVNNDRWVLSSSGGIRTDLARLTQGKVHSDHIEMGGKTVNAIVMWSVSKDGLVDVNRRIRWPMIRLKKDDTHSSLEHDFPSANDSYPTIDGKTYRPSPAHSFRIDGMLSWTEANAKVSVTRTIFPSVSSPCLLERWEIYNMSTKPVDINVPQNAHEQVLSAADYLWFAPKLRSEWINAGHYRLMPSQTLRTGMAFSARPEDDPALFPDIEAEWASRNEFVERLETDLSLQTGDPYVDQLFHFSKLRAAENVIATRGGLMHAPGGFNKYLAALWCNDQNEYVSPFFPFLGDPAGNESARNAYQWFARYMNPDFKPIPSSIVAEGRSFWDGAGDRGDAAMTAYGASRWALATGNPDLACEAWPFIEWCLEYCERKKTAEGVIASDSDELENRFTAGKTNLATSCLTYDALNSAAYLAEALGEPKSKSETYRSRARDLHAAIEKVFGATIKGHETYRYHEGLEKLRAWICLPLAMDINERTKGTVEALFSPDLWTADGLLTEAGTTTFWDRSTLYALRGVFRAGEPDKAAEYVAKYARRRLVGDHVPYAVEAYPEGNQSQLSAESGLYCRIFTEGVCGIRPIGFNSFTAIPRMPKAWPTVKLSNIHAFGRVWSYQATQKRGGVEVRITDSMNRECYRSTKPAGIEHLITLP